MMSMTSCKNVQYKTKYYTIIYLLAGKYAVILT